MGNPILSDDGVGIQVARAIQEKVDQPEITVLENSSGGLDLLEILSGYEKAIIIDAIQTPTGKAGQIYRLEPETLKQTRYTTSPHDVNLATALALGNKLCLDLPRQIIIYAIEVLDTVNFNEKCTPEVNDAIPVCTEMVIRELFGDDCYRW